MAKNKVIAAAAKRKLVASARTLPSGYDLAKAAIGDADKWWTAQGSAPPPLELSLGPPQDGEHVGYGWYHSGRVNVDPSYLQNLSGVLQNPQATRHGKIVALAGLWRLMAHERGHNIGYDHSPGGIMNEDTGAIPGQAFNWAVSVLGPPRK